MSVLMNVLKEEYKRSKRIVKSIDKELSKLPIGYISKKQIGGHIYYYIQFKENGKIKSQYINKKDAIEYNKKVLRRRELLKNRKELLMDQKRIERVLK